MYLNDVYTSRGEGVDVISLAPYLWCFPTRVPAMLHSYGFSCYCETMNEMAYLFIFHVSMDND